jgi:hypothetical protein
LMHPGPYLGALVAAFIVSPVLIWNEQHAWISFRFQGGRGTTSGLHLFSFLENIGGQLGYLLPWIGIPLAWVLCSVMIEAARGARAKDKSRSSAARWWLACLAIGPIASFTLIALGGHRGLPHWQAPGWLMVIPLLAERVDARLTRSSAKTRRNTRAWLMASTIAFVVVIVALATELRLGVVHRLAPSLFSRRDPATELIDWRELPGTIAPMLRPSNDGTHERPFVAATNWMDAAKISYALNGEADVVCLCTEPHHFAFVRRGSSYLSRDAIIVERAGLRHATSVPLAKYFRSVTPIGSTVIRRGGVPAMTLELYRGETLVSDVPARMP